MAINKNEKPTVAEGRNIRYLVLFIIILSTVIASGATIPFFYESQSIWYKFGADKTMLRAGKIIGITTVIFLFLQLLLAVRLPFLVTALGLKQLLFFHRTIGVLLLVFGFTHAALVLIPEGLDNLPLGKKYWPEMIGIVLLFIILFQIFSSFFRQFMHLPYHRWRFLHQFTGYFTLVLLWFHVPFVSESFQQTIPLISLLVITGFVILILGFSKLRTRLSSNSKSKNL